MDENDRLQEQVERFNRNNHDAPDHVAEVERLRAEIDRLTAERAALLAPVDGISEDLGVLANMACEDPKHNDLWCPTCEEYPTIRALAREAIHRRTELEEAQLTLAAEQGRAEGAPSEGWTCERIHRGRPTWLRRAIIQGYDGTFYVEYAPIGIDGWFWCFQSADVQTAFQPANTARAAMLAADASK